jgi:hypothetical protein
MRGVFVGMDVALVVFVDVNEFVFWGDEDEDLELVPDLVLVIDVVIVLVDVLLGVFNQVGAEDLVDVVVFVDVFEEVDENVGTTPSCLDCISNSRDCIELFGGVEPTAPIAKSNKSHRITFLNRIYISFLGLAIQC